MNHLQGTALNHIKNDGLLGDGFGSTPEMCKKNLIFILRGDKDAGHFISSGNSQSRSPSFTVELLKSRGIDIAITHNWLRILDCYTDPLGWKERLKERGAIKTPSTEASLIVNLCKDVRNLYDLFYLIIALGKGLVGEGKNRFSVAIDSVSEMLRHTSLSSVASLLSNIRSHGRCCSSRCITSLVVIEIDQI